MDYHSGEPFAGTDWTSAVAGGFVTWATQTYAENQNANALRWGTLYNFRFDANVAPTTSSVTIDLFRPGTPASVSAATVTPAACSALETVCGDGLDEDCDGNTDCADADCCHSAACAANDGDGDTYAAVCDCNNANATVYPGATQLCDGVNNDCNAPGWPAVPADELDTDVDGVRTCEGDCDDADPQRFPGNVESCDGIDNRCLGTVPFDEADADADGVRVCGGDCDDANPERYPGHAEACDGLDNDCSGGVPPDEGDSNGDGIRDCLADCDLGNAAVWSTPGEVRNLALVESGGVTTLTWDPPSAPGCTAPRYDTLRSIDPADFVALGECIESNGTDASSVDPLIPLEGEVAYYLVRCENDCPAGQGSLGTDSSSAPRTALACP